MGTLFQSTPPVWGATPSRSEGKRHRLISIHAPRVGGDRTMLMNGFQGSIISIHAPRVGGDYSIRQRYIDH